MNPAHAGRLARALIREHAPGWRFAWSQARTQFGLCSEVGDEHHPPRTIYLSRPLVLLNDLATIEDVIRHELAHAKAGNAAGHGRLWKTHALALGARPERCTVNAVVIEGNVIATCPECGTSFRQHKVSYALANTQACAPCYKRGKVVRFALARADTGKAIDTSTLKKPTRRRRTRRSRR